jgi:kynurenine 3-monooxygenase
MAKIALVGAGLGGALMACFLGRAGHEVTVVERRSDPRVRGFVGGRSINLALSTRGLHALRQIGLDGDVLRHAVPMRGRMIHPPVAAAELAFQPYSKNPTDAINSVSRGGLNLTLLEAAAKHPNVHILFDRRCVDLNPDRPAVTMQHESTGDRTTLEPEIVIGADGAFSAVRARLQWLDRFDFSQEYLEHGYKELHIPAADDGRGAFGRFRMEPNALHIWPRGGFMMIALPNIDGSFTCTCFWPLRGPNGLESLRTPAEIERFFGRHFPDAVPLMPTLVEDYQRNPNGSLLTIRCRPWRHSAAGGRATVLLGDAAHAIVPFYGQGMNAAFEDCVALDECMRRLAPDWPAAFEAFERARKPHTDAIADLAIENFIEMRDRTASRTFRAWKKSEKLLHRWFPMWFTPLYHMVSFSTIGYADARARDRRQMRVLRAIAAVIILALVVLAAIVILAAV